MEMPSPTSSQKGRLSPRPRSDAPNAITAAKPQAKISRRLASRDPVVEVPNAAASRRCSATMTAAKIRGLRGIPARAFASFEFSYLHLFYGWPRGALYTRLVDVPCPIRVVNRFNRGGAIQFLRCGKLASFEWIAVL